MDGSDENNPPIIISYPNGQVSEGLQARRGGKALPIGHNRRALKDITDNIAEAPLYPYPCAVNKRTTFDKDDGSGTIPTTPRNRPVTRKFTANVAFLNHFSTEEIKEPNVSEKSANEELDDCVIIDAYDYKDNNDTSVPMFVQHTEAMLKEIDRMDDEEVEMEDVDDGEMLDIDSDDQNNPLAITDYIEDIYAYYKKMEGSSCVPSDYMDRQPDINEKMRAILIDWLIEVHYKFELMEETLYLTVNLIDRFLALRPVIRKKLQLVGVTAMLLACKYEEVSVPVIEDLVLISDKAYSRHEILEMEKLMINSLQFNLSIPTLYVFMRRFLKAAHANKQLELLAFFLIELCLVEHEMVRFSPSLLAAAAVFSAMNTLNGSTQWTKTCEWHTGYSQEQLLECSRLMVIFHQKAATGKLTGVHRKYSTSKYGYTARCEPALFLLDAVGFSGWNYIN